MILLKKTSLFSNYKHRSTVRRRLPSHSILNLLLTQYCGVLSILDMVIITMIVHYFHFLIATDHANAALPS